MSSTTYIELRSEADLGSMLRSVGQFHDGLVKEVHWVNPSNITEKRSMMLGRGLPAARLLIQHQGPGPTAVELLAWQVSYLRLEPEDIIWTSTFELKEDGPGRIVLRLGESELRCDRLAYRAMPEWTGDEVRFGAGSLPLPPGL